MQKITTFLTFDHQAEEAVALYTSLLPGSRVVSTARYGDAGPGKKGSVMTMEFELAGQRFVALNGGPTFTFSQGISLLINCETQEEVDGIWSKLLDAGGKEVACGWLTDRFGVSWQVVPTILPKLLGSGDAARSQRVMQAMFGMKKLDIAKLKAAFEGA
ncbi:MAG TPA: VOC family protein [Minicystis sp.]|nr:VOC family protein [Minicystis sp.]